MIYVTAQLFSKYALNGLGKCATLLLLVLCKTVSVLYVFQARADHRQLNYGPFILDLRVKTSNVYYT